MRGLDNRIVELASGQRFLVTRAEVFDLGGTDEMVMSRLESGLWTRIHPGVYQIDRRPLDWESRLLAAALACGPDARVSHRAALVLWGMDGVTYAPLEVTMPFGNLAAPDGVIVHRSRHPTPKREHRGIPVSGPERTILECSLHLPPITLGKALDSAIRLSLTTIDRMWLMLATEGGRGVKGTRRLKQVLNDRTHDTATDSGAEFELLYHMKRRGLPMPVLGFEIQTDSGRRIPDLAWPDRNKGVEVDGVDAHDSADKLDDDLTRQNDLMNLGLDIRRFSARQIRRDPQGVVDQISQFLEA